jgi:hypothetical protein
VCGIATDITLSKRAELELQQQPPDLAEARDSLQSLLLG